MPEFPDWLGKAAKTILDHCNTECDEKRKYMLPIWNRAEYYWNDIQDLFWNPIAEDWSTFDEEEGEDEFDAIKDSNKIINTYRAYGESVIAAATIGNLSIRFFPKNADNPLDLDKAHSFSEKSDYIQKENNIRELRRKAFTIRWNQGLVGSYVHFERNKNRFGTFKKDNVANKSVVTVNESCQNCGYKAEPKKYEDPEEIAGLTLAEPSICPECIEEPVPMQSEQSLENIPYVSSTDEIDRGCAVIDLFDPLHMKVPFYATKRSEIDYVIVEREVHYSKARSWYPDFAEQINPGNTNATESESRKQADNYGTLSSRNLVTITYIWVKPSLYNIVEDSKEAKKILKMYPDGKFSTFINGQLMVDCQNEDMDKVWTFVESALDTHVYIRALGNAMIPIQDMENDMIFLTVDTIKHAIGETFYDERIIDANRYRESQTKPGSMYPVMNKRGNVPISEYFYSTKNASLSREVDTFQERLRTSGQLVTGAFPSIYGGALEGGSKTLGVYQESRAQALQRVSIPTNNVDDFLAETIRKATELYDANMEDEENYTAENGSGFKNITMRKSAPGAQVSRVEVVKSEQFPTTWEQKRAFVMELIDKQLDPINSTIFSSDNIGFISRIVGIPELKVPGEADRDKQLHEIQELLKAEPIMPEEGQTIPEGQQPQIQSTVAVDPDVDNHSVHIGTIISWAVSVEGIRTKKENPGGYANVIAHMTEHKMMAPPEMAAPEEKSDGPEE